MEPYILISNSLNPYLNLAVESYLVEHCKIAEVGLFLWRNDKTVVIGKNQNPFAECNVNALKKDNGFLARRLTGGGAVYHDEGNVNFSFIVSKDIYNVERQLNIIIKALKIFNIDAEFNGRNDITTDGKKFSGNAFLHKKNCSLHHGTILIKLNKDNMEKFLTISKEKLYAKGVKSTSSRIINLEQLSTEINYDSLSKALIACFIAEYGNAQELDFGSLVAKGEVPKLQQLFASKDFLFGKWKEEVTTSTMRYEWGCLSTHKDIEGNNIAYSTDCMYPNVMEKVYLLRNKKDVVFEDNLEREIANTILSQSSGNTTEG